MDQVKNEPVFGVPGLLVRRFRLAVHYGRELLFALCQKGPFRGKYIPGYRVIGSRLVGGLDKVPDLLLVDEFHIVQGLRSAFGMPADRLFYGCFYKNLKPE